jgi:hypothetical protein
MPKHAAGTARAVPAAVTRMTEANPILSAEQVVSPAYMEGMTSVECPNGCGAMVYGNEGNIDSGLRKHLEFCQGPQARVARVTFQVLDENERISSTETFLVPNVMNRDEAIFRAGMEYSLMWPSTVEMGPSARYTILDVKMGDEK